MLRARFKVRLGLTWVRTGHLYSFRYKRFQYDPEPTVIVLYAVGGTHPKTGNRHNYIQAINLNYITRGKRREFVAAWTQMLKQYGGNVIFTWNMVKRKYPYLQVAFRRYSLDRGIIVKLKEIPLEEINQAVVGTWAKDYSKQAMMSLISKYRKAKKSLDINTIKRVFGGVI